VRKSEDPLRHPWPGGCNLPGRRHGAVRHPSGAQDQRAGTRARRAPRTPGLSGGSCRPAASSR